MTLSPIIAEDVAGLLHDLGDSLDALAGTTLLVTGAGGFLCSYLVDLAMAWNAQDRGSPCRVLALDNYKTGTPDRLAHLAGRPDLTILTHDITEPLAIDGPVDWIVHGASIASPTVYRQYPLETLDANVGGTRHMLDLARAKASRGMLVMSTSEIYGDPDPAFIPTPESYRGNVSCTGPRACYDESKRMAETLATIYHRQYGTPIKIIRPFNVYGPGLRLDDRRVIPDFMQTVLAREPIVLLSDGRPTRAFCYVTDAVRAMLLILLSTRTGEPYNVGNDMEEISMAELARRTAATALAELGPPVPEVEFRVSPDRDYLIDNPQRRCADLGKLRTDFPGWQPRIPLNEGLSRLLRWYMGQR